VLPKSADVGDSEGYSKKIYWVSKATNTVRKGEYYDASGDLLKVLTTSDVKLLDPAKKRYRAMKLEMENKKNGRKSVFETEKIAFSPNVKDEYFTNTYLEKP
jgi:outer membrane lipoprotein-sorting protein